MNRRLSYVITCRFAKSSYKEILMPAILMPLRACSRALMRFLATAVLCKEAMTVVARLYDVTMVRERVQPRLRYRCSCITLVCVYSRESRKQLKQQRKRPANPS
jgi:hypothetical protein